MDPGQNGSMSVSTYIYMSSEARANKQGQFGEMRRKWKFCLPVDKDLTPHWIQQGSNSVLDPTRISLHTGSNKDRAATDWDQNHTAMTN